MSQPSESDRPSYAAIRAWEGLGDRIALTLGLSKSSLEDNPGAALQTLEAEWTQEKEDATSLLLNTIWKNRSDVRSLVLNNVDSPILAIRRVCVKAIGRHHRGSKDVSLAMLLQRIANNMSEDESLRSAAATAIAQVRDEFERREVEQFIERAIQVECSESLLITALQRVFGLPLAEISRILLERESPPGTSGPT